MLHEAMSYSYEPTINDEIQSMNGRLTPIGGASSDTDYDRSFNEEYGGKDSLAEEHEKLNASLSALTCHFAHVQLRLQQVVSAPTPEDREKLLAELHKFASNGIPDIMVQSSSLFSNEKLMTTEKSREQECINELKQKLDEVEQYAAASGVLEGAPTLLMIEKQRLLIDELRKKLDLQLDDASVSKLTAEELRKLVDQSIYQLTNPVKIKNKLITQMRTQITDLEKFIDFLKADAAKSAAATASHVPSTTVTTVDLSYPIQNNSTKIKAAPSQSSNPTESSESSASCFPFQRGSLNILQPLRKLFILTQIYTIFLFTFGSRLRKRKTGQTTSTVKKDLISKKHYGDLRAQLEVAIEKVLQSQRTNIHNNEEEQEVKSSPATISAVRHALVPALHELLEHGFCQPSYTTSISLWICLPIRSADDSAAKKENMHIWQLFLKYYDMKKGHEFTNSPARKLSQTFALDIVGGKPITPRENLLSTIDTIARMHQKRMNEMDSCFKSFVCHVLNEKNLVKFLRLILQTGPLIEEYYEPWSYTKQTGFNDALHSLNRLTSMDFHLPVNTSARRFLNNQELIE